MYLDIFIFGSTLQRFIIYSNFLFLNFCTSRRAARLLRSVCIFLLLFQRFDIAYNFVFCYFFLFLRVSASRATSTANCCTSMTRYFFIFSFRGSYIYLRLISWEIAALRVLTRLNDVLYAVDIVLESLNMHQ